MDMAADDNKLKVQIIHGHKKHSLNLPMPSDADSDGVLTVMDLAQQVAALTRVPVGSQKLIFKGKSLADMDLDLQAAGVKTGSKIMLIGKPYNPDEDENMKIMLAVESEIEKLEKKVQEIMKELDGIEKGFLAKDHQQEALAKLSRRALGSAEDFTKLLERLDSLSLGESWEEVRVKRKRLVQRIQKNTSKCDDLRHSIDKTSEKLKPG